MDRIRIRGGQRLAGEVRTSGARNAALPLLAAALAALGARVERPPLAAA